MLATTIPHDVESAVNELLESHFSGNITSTFDLEKLNLRIKIDGENWIGNVNLTLAKFVVGINERVKVELDALGVVLPDDNHGLVSIRVEDGCTEGYFRWVPNLTEAFKKLDLRSQLVLVGAVLGGGFRSEVRQ